MEGEDIEENVQSPTNSQKTVSDDDEIDYSIKPEFYDSGLDDKDESWMHKKREGRASDAVLSCPGCFNTLCVECQRHEKYVTQYRAVIVVNCKTESDQIRQNCVQQKRFKRQRASDEDNSVPPVGGEIFKAVCCSICSTEVGVIDDNEVYHFFNVIPSES